VTRYGSTIAAFDIGRKIVATPDKRANGAFAQILPAARNGFRRRERADRSDDEGALGQAGAGDMR